MHWYFFHTVLLQKNSITSIFGSSIIKVFKIAVKNSKRQAKGLGAVTVDRTFGN